ncbi:NUDIX hydrolase [Sphingobacterium sp. LRF_L2]|uniref:NUDIX hydrolase n=1 Tax=Sphingobacterium sp. LRF_L2 TaxID=3369421 RepID=UPI003F5FC5D7
MTDFKQQIIQGSIEAYKKYVPHISIDTVIFGFEEHELHVLLLKMNYNQQWFLPGGYLLKEENLEEAANRILFERSGAENIFLKEFGVFGDYGRTQDAFKDFDNNLWHKQRFITIGYYALVNYRTVKPIPDIYSELCQWVPLTKLNEISLTMDHSKIIQNALQTLRTQLSYQPIGYNLLPEKFTLTEFQRLYEIILGRTLNRGNFYRKIKNLGILKKLEEQRSGGAHRPADYYIFEEDAYNKALETGIDKW